jgi:uncharacterized membrane protein YkoI
MKIRRSEVLAAAILLIGLGLGSSQALAGERHRPGERDQRSEDHRGISQDEAVRRAERRFNARVVKAETRTVDGRKVHVLRLVSDDGRVFTVRVDAETGNMD